MKLRNLHCHIRPSTWAAARRITPVAMAWTLMMSASLGAAPFDADRAMDDIRAQCDLGPRIPGTTAHAEAREWISARLAETGLMVWEQPFQTELALIEKENVRAWNIWGVPPSSTDAPDAADAADGEGLILLSAHWDTRPWADRDRAGGGRAAFDGANDGAAGVATILEIIRSLRGTRFEGRVAVAFFDAEDSGIHGSENEETWCKGSQFAVANLPPWFPRVRLGINLDMIAGADLALKREQHSIDSAPDEVETLWRIGRDFAPKIFVGDVMLPMIDDHLAFVKAGYPYIDLIGLPYEHWHRTSDTPENCDPVVMRTVAGILVQFIREELRKQPHSAPSAQD